MCTARSSREFWGKSGKREREKRKAESGNGEPESGNGKEEAEAMRSIHPTKYPEHRRRLITLAPLWLFLTQVLAVRAADAPKPSSQETAFFENKIRPVLVQHCYKCHSAEAPKVKGELLLDSR